jgi:uncharacterized RmlC-like cupin family protein
VAAVRQERDLVVDPAARTDQGLAMHSSRPTATPRHRLGPEVLYDGRAESPTFDSFQEHHMTASAPALLLIPPGVWHASQNWGEDEAAIVNFPTRPYDREEPDKYGTDPHSGEIPFDWSLRDG